MALPNRAIFRKNLLLVDPLGPFFCLRVSHIAKKSRHENQRTTFPESVSTHFNIFNVTIARLSFLTMAILISNAKLVPRM